MLQTKSNRNAVEAKAERINSRSRPRTEDFGFPNRIKSDDFFSCCCRRRRRLYLWKKRLTTLSATPAGLVEISINAGKSSAFIKRKYRDKNNGR